VGVCDLIPAMQTLGVSNTTPQSESRLKNLFWPTIRTGDDVDTVGAQGYWICAIVAAYSLVFSLYTGHPIVGFCFLIYYYFGGVGVREQSRYAASIVFVMYVLGTIVTPGVVRVILCAALLSNLRATWIASRWKPEIVRSELPIRLNATWGDKFADRLPPWLWPKVRIGYYIFSIGLLVVTIIGLLIP
jgi:hypothetical protein